MEGRCKDCTLDERLRKLQVLRLITRAAGDRHETEKKTERTGTSKSTKTQ